MLDLVRKAAATEDALRAALAGEIDAVLDHETATPLLLREAQHALQQSVRQYRRLVDRIGATIFELDASGTTLFVSPAVAAMTGYTPAELMARDWWSVFTPDDLRPNADAFLMAIRHDDVTGYELILRGKFGALVTLEVNTANDYDESGNVARVLGFATDATRRKRAEEANMLKARFLAMISHELRTPLTAIKGFASTMIAPDIVISEVEQREYAQIINDEADKLTHLIEQLLTLTRLQAGSFTIKPEKVEVCEILDSIRAELDNFCQQHKLKVSITGDNLAVMADKQRIGQVIGNLVHNSCKYSPPQSQVTISVRREMEAVRFEVTDQGSGIDPGEQALIFDSFYQVTKHPWGQMKGAGLGLAICKGLVEAHHGRIWVVESDLPGAMIAFTVPAA